MSETSYSRYIAWQRRVAPFSGTLVALTGLVILLSTFFQMAKNSTMDLSVSQRVILGLFFVMWGLVLLWWGKRKRPSSGT